MTSEEKHEIMKQPAESCPIAAEATELLHRALGYVEGYARVDEVEPLHDILWNVEYYASGVAEKIEQLRRANEEIRNWGEQWKTLAKSLDAEIESSSANISIVYGNGEKVHPLNRPHF